ncbi:MAG: M48 family metalloprotease [Rhodospirillaceae bacterium]
MIKSVSPIWTGTARGVVTRLVVLALLLVPAGPASAQRAEKLDFIRDAEIEHIIRGYARPIFQAAGIEPDSVEIVLIKDSTVNAFVAGGMNMFFHTGLLIECDNPEQLIGVIAHETGHIAGGHLIRGREAMEAASAEAILAMLLGVGAAVASGQAGAGAAIITGGQGMAMRNLLAFSRAQEASADAAGMTFLERAHISPRGMHDFLEKLAGQEYLPPDRQVAYTRTHPVTHDRIDSVQHYLESSPWKDAKLPAADNESFARLKGKLIGFVKPALALRRYSPTDTSIAARYALAIAYYQQGDLKTALPMIDELIAREPNNPYFYELKGQVLMEYQRLPESLPPYRRSVALAPESGLLRGALAQALIETNDPKNLEEALKNLQFATRQEKSSSHLWRLVATAWGRKNKDAMVAYAMAEEALARGDRAMARHQAERAEKMLPAGSPEWLRAQDIRGVVDRPKN